MVELATAARAVEKLADCIFEQTNSQFPINTFQSRIEQVNKFNDVINCNGLVYLVMLGWVLLKRCKSDISEQLKIHTTSTMFNLFAFHFEDTVVLEIQFNDEFRI